MSSLGAKPVSDYYDKIGARSTSGAALGEYQIGDGCRMAFDKNSNVAQIQTTGRIRSYAKTDNFTFEWSNAAMNAAAASGAHDGGSITIKASVTHRGTVYPLFFGGQREGVIPNGGFIRHDKMYLPLEAGEFVQLTWRQTNNNDGTNKGILWVQGAGLRANTLPNSGWKMQSSVTANLPDYTDTPDLIPNGSSSTGSMCYPCAMLSDISTDQMVAIRPCVLNGDSQTSGIETFTGGIGGYGLLDRLTINKVPTIVVARFGSQANQWNNTGAVWGARMLAKFLAYAPTYIGMFGSNDLPASGTAANLKSSIKSIRTAAVALGAPWHQQIIATIPPRTTGVWDGVGAQTSVYNSGQYALHNTAVRNGEFDGYIDYSGVIETAVDSGIWKGPGYTTDGAHGTALAWAAIEAECKIVGIPQLAR